MKWFSRAGLFACLLLLTSCGGGDKAVGGFADDPRPTFQRDNPYEDVSRVSWSSWSEETLARADSDTPVLLDLGGLWCHWCHIFDEMMYGDKEIADFIEDNFIPVRVDPDARPDIDLRYNRGSWPSICVLTPEGDMVTGATFMGKSAFRQFLDSALQSYRAGGDSLRGALSDRRLRMAQAQAFIKDEGVLDGDIRRKVIAGIRQYFDSTYGGILSESEDGGKLLMPIVLSWLLEEALREGEVDAEVESFVKRTLEAIADGGIRDHLHGGYFRASANRSWSVPHFEKFLDIQSGMIELYLEASKQWHTDRYEALARETVEFVMASMMNPDSTTFSNAIDADIGPSDDGSFYTWTVQQVDTLLSAEEAQVVKTHYGVALHGEMPDDPHQNVLLESGGMAKTAERLEMNAEQVQAILDRAMARMRGYRLAGERPRIDSSAYAAQNLRMARALLLAGKVFGEPAYDRQALRTIDFFTDAVYNALDGVPHVFDGMQAHGPRILDDQVAALEACLSAYEATDDERYLSRARDLYTMIRQSYRNEISGAFWDLSLTETGPGRLVLRVPKIGENVRLAQCAMDLYVATAVASYRDDAEATLQSFSSTYPSTGWDAVGYALAVDRLTWRLREIPS